MDGYEWATWTPTSRATWTPTSEATWTPPSEATCSTSGPYGRLRVGYGNTGYMGADKWRMTTEPLDKGALRESSKFLSEGLCTSQSST